MVFPDKANSKSIRCRVVGLPFFLEVRVIYRIREVITKRDSLPAHQIPFEYNKTIDDKYRNCYASVNPVTKGNLIVNFRVETMRTRRSHSCSLSKGLAFFRLCRFFCVDKGGNFVTKVD